MSTGEGYDVSNNRWNTPTAVVAWIVLLVFTTITCLVNARYATMTGSHVAFHAAIPVSVLVTAVFAEMTALSSAHRWVKWACVSVLVGIFGAVLVASYLGVLFVFLEWNPNPSDAARGVYHIVAAIPDALMVVSGTVLMSLRMRRKNPALEAPKPDAPSRWRRIADAATARAEAVLAVPESPQVDAIVEARGALAEPAVETSRRVEAPSMEPPVEDEPTAVKPSMEPAVEVNPAPTEPSVETVVEEEPAPAKPSVKSSVEPVDPALEPFMEAAEVMVEEKIVARKSAVELAEVIAAVERRWSPNRIKTELGVSPSTTAKVTAAWDAWRAQEEMETEPALTAVG